MLPPAAGGLSPLARGNQRVRHPGRRAQGPIPARAGEPPVSLSLRPNRGGLSPLARGNRVEGLQRHAPVGPIPARAGEPWPDRSGRGRPWAYPRSRGGTHRILLAVCARQGLSPLARGNRRYGAPWSVLMGPIPARAGEPPAGKKAGGRGRAYPRSRGGTSPRFPGPPAPSGLSPLSRGNHAHHGARNLRQGPIPARAGEPATTPTSRPGPRAYPRSRGGTERLARSWSWEPGLSPLARGNLVAGLGVGAQHGPIPARAGEPPCPRAAPPSGRAYPRSRGGTAKHRAAGECALGLSPLARGNLHNQAVPQVTRGPIPARAGEPPSLPLSSRRRRAYPRSRGGTAVLNLRKGRSEGLSPLARGNHVGAVHVVVRDGPIPARAGEPSSAFIFCAGVMGLSPLARGNPFAAYVRICPPGPIPARAGEPRPRLRSVRPKKAYPRSRGGTSTRANTGTKSKGLSPLARGNPQLCGIAVVVGGPIPARAGEPTLHGVLLRLLRAYPRSRGGTGAEAPPRSPDEGLSPLARGNRR